MADPAYADWPYWDLVELFFALFLLVEILVRLYAEGLSFSFGIGALLNVLMREKAVELFKFHHGDKASFIFSFWLGRMQTLFAG